MKIAEVVPWLVRSESTGWGEYLFVEVRTDEGVTGWGEITTTTPTANGDPACRYDTADVRAARPGSAGSGWAAPGAA
jgi:L-alanine-DL-glutamate epimerase-like enolase superfamily enzyme